MNSLDYIAANINDERSLNSFKQFLKTNSTAIKGGVIFSYLPEIKKDKDLKSKFLVTPIHTPFQQILSSMVQLKSNRNDKNSIIDPIHIMSVDNEEINLRIIERFLKGYPIKVSSFTNPLIAIESAKNHPYDLILMDIFMPEMKGYDASAIIRKNGANQNTPIIAATATVSSGERKCIFQNKMTDILIKPFNKDLLLSIIQKHKKVETIYLSKEKIENIDVNAAIMKSIVNIRGFGDINSELSKIIEIEKLTTVLFYTEHIKCKDEFSKLFYELKIAYYHKNSPIETFFDQINELLITIENQISSVMGNNNVKI